MMFAPRSYLPGKPANEPFRFVAAWSGMAGACVYRRWLVTQYPARNFGIRAVEDPLGTWTWAPPPSVAYLVEVEGPAVLAP